jgi:hypothetical protein
LYPKASDFIFFEKQKPKNLLFFFTSMLLTLITQVSDGSPAAVAGLQVADRILVLGTLDAEAINRKVKLSPHLVIASYTMVFKSADRKDL